MNCRHLYIAIVAIGIGCLGSLSAEACEVNLIVTNRSLTTIVEVGYRNAGLDTWSGPLISNPVGSNNTQSVTWQGNGDYELSIRFTDPQTPIVVPVRDVCAKSEVIANPDGIVVR
jgi:hypothetical protein